MNSERGRIAEQENNIKKYSYNKADNTYPMASSIFDVFGVQGKDNEQCPTFTSYEVGWPKWNNDDR